MPDPIHFWRKGYFEALKNVEALAAKVPEWQEYANFLYEYEMGLRDKAFATLDRFIVLLEVRPFAERRSFVSWLLSVSEGREGRHMLMPHPLYVRLLEPTLMEWALVEPQCGEPYRWLGGYDHLKRAIELDPHDQIARRRLIASILSRIGHSTHELPRGYLGDPYADLASLDEAEGLIKDLASDSAQEASMAAEIAEDRALIKRYLESR